MKSRLNPNSVMFTDGVHQGGVSFDGTNFKAEDGDGNLIGLAVKEPETDDEAVPLKLLNVVRAFTVPPMTIVNNLDFSDGQLDFGTAFVTGWPDEYAKIQSHLKPTEKIMMILLYMVIRSNRKSVTHAGETVSFTASYTASGGNIMIPVSFPGIPLDSGDVAHVSNWSIIIHRTFDNPITELTLHSPNAEGWKPMTDYYIVLERITVYPLVFTCNTEMEHYAT